MWYITTCQELPVTHCGSGRDAHLLPITMTGTERHPAVSSKNKTRQHYFSGRPVRHSLAHRATTCQQDFSALSHSPPFPRPPIRSSFEDNDSSIFVGWYVGESEPVGPFPCVTHGLPLASPRPELIDGCFQLNQVIKLTWEQLSLLSFAKTLSDSSIFQLILILLYWLWVILIASWKDSLDFLENLNIFFLTLLIPWVFLLHCHSAHTYCKVSPHLPVNSDLHGSQTLCFKGLVWLTLW